MSTVIKNEKGEIVRELPGTKYHPDGTGPRDSKGRPIVDAVAEEAPAESTQVTDAAAAGTTKQKGAR